MGLRMAICYIPSISRTEITRTVKWKRSQLFLVSFFYLDAQLIALYDQSRSPMTVLRRGMSYTPQNQGIKCGMGTF